MRTKRAVGWTIAGVVLFGLCFIAIDGEWIPGPKPTFPDGAGVRTYVDENSLPLVFENGFAVAVGPIRRDSADFGVYFEDDRDDAYAILRVGETATLDYVTITLCDTWVNNWAYIGPKSDGGTRSNASRAYYVQSTDGSTPTCP